MSQREALIQSMRWGGMRFVRERNVREEGRQRKKMLIFSVVGTEQWGEIRMEKEENQYERENTLTVWGNPIKWADRSELVWVRRKDAEEDNWHVRYQRIERKRYNWCPFVFLSIRCDTSCVYVMWCVSTRAIRCVIWPLSRGIPLSPVRVTRKDRSLNGRVEESQRTPCQLVYLTPTWKRCHIPSISRLSCCILSDGNIGPFTDGKE